MVGAPRSPGAPEIKSGTWVFPPQSGTACFLARGKRSRNVWRMKNPMENCHPCCRNQREAVTLWFTIRIMYLVFIPFPDTEVLKPLGSLTGESYKGIFCCVNGDFRNTQSPPESGGWSPHEPACD